MLALNAGAVVGSAVELALECVLDGRQRGLLESGDAESDAVEVSLVVLSAAVLVPTNLFDIEQAEPLQGFARVRIRITVDAVVAQPHRTGEGPQSVLEPRAGTASDHEQHRDLGVLEHVEPAVD